MYIYTFIRVEVDLTLIHSPPCVVGAKWNDGCMGNPAMDLVYPRNCDCAAAEPCEMMQQQWLAMEKIYKVTRPFMGADISDIISSGTQPQDLWGPSLRFWVLSHLIGFSS